MSLIGSLTDRFESAARKFLPYSLMVLLLLLNSVSVPFVMAGEIKAPLFLMAVYYWSIFRPQMLPPWMAFAAGIAADLLGGLPLGLNAIVFVLVQWVVSDQRRFLMGQSFVMIWFGFLFLSLAAGLMQWSMYGLMHGAWTPVRAVLFSVLLGLAVFPLICVTLHWTHRILPSSARS